MIKSIYRITFVSQGTHYEIYARKITQSSLLGFIEVEELIFGEKNSLLVDPAEEKLKNEFSSVKKCYLPLHTILRIDVVEKEGISKARELSDKTNNVTYFPNPIISN